MAKIALLYSSVFGEDAYQSLLAFMHTERNDTLEEVTNEFMDICHKLLPPIDVFCAYEQVPTVISYGDRLAQKAPTLLKNGFFKAGARRFMEHGFAALGAGKHFVEKESAVLQGAQSVGLTAGHSDLVKFESISSGRFVPVKAALSRMAATAKINARKRAHALGQNLTTQKFVNQVKQALQSVDMRSKFLSKVKARPATSWLESEPVFQDWLTPTSEEASYLWVKGGPGLGKTNAALAAIQHISRAQNEEARISNTAGRSETFLAYFLCEDSTGCCTAEDLLKSLITQMIDQEDSLAQHAKWVAPNPQRRGPAFGETGLPGDGIPGGGAQATATVDNLWKYLQDMIEDPAVGSAHFIISNMHCLETNGATKALLSKMAANAYLPEGLAPTARRAKWLVTSRQDSRISKYMMAERILLIDLEDEMEYGNKVKVARQTYARDRVSRLSSARGYASDLAYCIRNSIESQPEDETWIDVLCILLEAKPADIGTWSLRRWLREVENYNTNTLIDRAWEEILSAEKNARVEVEDLALALTITYEPPTLADLAVLVQSDSIEHLKSLIQKCSPFILIGSSGEHRGRVVFAHAAFAKRLSSIAHGQLNPPSQQGKRHHGLMALRCFAHIKSSYQDVSPQSDRFRVAQGLTRAGSSSARVIDNANILVMTNEEDDEAGEHTASGDSITGCSYATKYLFRHLSEGLPDVAQALYDEDPDFWGKESRVRSIWLQDFQATTSVLKDLNLSGMSALHIAAGVGAKEMVATIVRRVGTSALSWVGDEGTTALHVAAFNDQAASVETLIAIGADIEAGEGDAGTALHLAALRGNYTIMRLLIEHGANINAYSRTIGPVINAAIRSGTLDAVKQIMDGDVRFDADYTKCDPPLSLSAGISEPSVFQDILETGREKWLQNVKLLDRALVAASYSGRLESVRILLTFQHNYTDNTIETAILSAALEKNWASVSELLDYATEAVVEERRRQISLERAFYLAAISREEQLPILERMWKFTKRAISQETRDFSLYQATALKKEATVMWLLDTCSANPNATAEAPATMDAGYVDVAASSDFGQALNAAAHTGNTRLVKSLIDHGAAVDGEDIYALQLASSEGHTEVVEALLERGASVDKIAVGNDNVVFYSATAMQAACENNKLQTVAVLLRYGADPNLGGGPLSNPITAATIKGHREVLELLLSAPNIDVNVRGSEDQSTPLINAATRMSVGAVKLLLDRGADVNCQNAAGDTALIMAAWKGEQACVELLCEAGADVTYRSPRQGLAIQVAAQMLQPLCAHTLAEWMVNTIEDYREQVKIDPCRERLDQALATLKERDVAIESLEAFLAETKEQLEIANNNIDFHKLDNERLVSEDKHKGETYASTPQQIKAVQNERAELVKQLESSMTQSSVYSNMATKLQAQIEEEKATNAALRSQQAWVALQKERQDSAETVEKLKRDSSEAAELAEQEKKELCNFIEVLQNTLSGEEDERAILRATLEGEVKARAAETAAEKQKCDRLQVELTALREQLGAMEQALEWVGNVVRRNPGQDGQTASRNGFDSNSRQDYSASRTHSNRAGSDGEAGSDPETAPPPLPVRKPRSSPAGQKEVASASQTSDGAGSPGTTAGPFRTVHGVHRADGSLGGYKHGENAARPTNP